MPQKITCINASKCSCSENIIDRKHLTNNTGRQNKTVLVSANYHCKLKVMVNLFQMPVSIQHNYFNNIFFCIYIIIFILKISSLVRRCQTGLVFKPQTNFEAQAESLLDTLYSRFCFAQHTSDVL